MRSDTNILMHVREWLDVEKHSQAWLAKEMSVAPSLISQLFSGERKLQPSHIEKMAEITGKSIAELAASDSEQADQVVYSLRGKISNEAGERALTQLLLDAEHFVQLIQEK